MHTVEHVEETFETTGFLSVLRDTGFSSDVTHIDKYKLSFNTQYNVTTLTVTATTS